MFEYCILKNSKKQNGNEQYDGKQSIVSDSPNRPVYAAYMMGTWALTAAAGNRIRYIIKRYIKPKIYVYTYVQSVKTRSSSSCVIGIPIYMRARRYTRVRKITYEYAYYNIIQYYRYIHADARVRIIPTLLLLIFTTYAARNYNATVARAIRPSDDYMCI